MSPKIFLLAACLIFGSIFVNAFLSDPATIVNPDARDSNALVAAQPVVARATAPQVKQETEEKEAPKKQEKPAAKPAKQEAETVKPKKKSAAERRREEILKGQVDETEDRPDKPSFADRPKSKNGIADVTFDDIKFEMEKTEIFKREMLTDEINEMDGTRITLRGYIRPSTRQKGLKKFVFVRDNKECCFGPGAALFDCVLVKLAKGESSDFTVRPVSIEGDFYVKEYRGPDGRIWAVFRMKNGVVK